MKYDSTDSLIREKYPPGHIANLGDACAETARAKILGERRGSISQFVTETGFLRHPKLAGVAGWDVKDFSNDQLLALLMATRLNSGVEWVYADGPCIRGTKTKLSIGSWAAVNKHYRLLNLANIVQGWIFKFPYRFGDDGKLEKSEGKVQDYLNAICIYVYLRKLGKWATLPAPREKCLAAVRKYYLEGKDFEPNSAWLVELYERALA